MSPERQADDFDSIDDQDRAQQGNGDASYSLRPMAALTHDELTALSENLAKRLVSERDRIGQELIDTLIHQLYAITLDLHSALAHTHEPHATIKIHAAIAGLDNAVVDIRNMIFTNHYQRKPTTRQPETEK